MDRRILALLLVCLSIMGLTGFELVSVLASPADSPNTIVTPGSLVGDCVFYKGISNYYGHNCSTQTGDNDYSGSDCVTVLNSIIANAPVAGITIRPQAFECDASTSLNVYTSGNTGIIRIIGAGDAGTLGLSSTGNQGFLLKLNNNVNKDVVVVGNTNGPFNPNGLIENIWLENIAVDGNKANQSAGDCIHGFSWSGGGITHSTIHNCKGQGIELDKGAGGGSGTGCCLDISGNTIEFGSGDGIKLSGTVYDFVHHNHIEQWTGNCVNINTSKERVESNNLLQCGFNALQAAHPVAVLVGGTLSRVFGNYLEQSEFDGILVAGHQNTILENQIEQSGFQGQVSSYDGIKINYQNNTIADNTITDAGSPQTTHLAIEEVAGALNNTIIDNKAPKCCKDGTYATVSTSKTLWEGNTPFASVTAVTQASPYTNADPYSEFLIVTTVNGATAFICNGAAMGSPTLGMTCFLRTSQTMSWSTANPTFSKQPQ